jgi:pimeloyl-ACP methyl ester carboxylesterase
MGQFGPFFMFSGEGMMETASINDAEIEYDVTGAGEPVLLLHGVLLGDSFRPMLAEPGVADSHRCITWHRRGYAGSRPGPGTDSVTEAAADARALLEHLGIDRAHVVGHSYGGCVALQLALDAPEMIHSLALIEAALLVGPKEHAYRDALERNVAAFDPGDAEAFVDEFIGARWPDYRPILDWALPGAFQQAVADARTVFEGELPGLGRWSFGEAEAQTIERPTLTILGGDSDAIGRRFGDAHRWLLATFPNAEEVVLPGMTHLPQMQDPAATANAISGFWARHRMPKG